MKHLITVLAIAALTTITISCKKKDEKIKEQTLTETTKDNTADKIKLGETFIAGAAAKAIVYGTKEAETGFNEIFVAFYDSTDGSKLSQGHLYITPVMNMGSMTHSSPSENTEDTVSTDGYFKGGLVFSMPGNSNQWQLELSFHNHKNNKSGIGKLGLNVKASSPSKFKSTVALKDNNSSIFISLANLTKPIVGINDFEVVLHKKINTMEYAPINDYTIEIEPHMPSMSHGSPNNVNPILSKKGHYHGKVNFTMSGLWQIKIKLYKESVLISDDQYFEITI